MGLFRSGYITLDIEVFRLTVKEASQRFKLTLKTNLEDIFFTTLGQVADQEKGKNFSFEIHLNFAGNEVIFKNILDGISEFNYSMFIHEKVSVPVAVAQALKNVYQTDLVVSIFEQMRTPADSVPSGEVISAAGRSSGACDAVRASLELRQCLRKMLADKFLADIGIVSKENDTFACHQNIISSNSSVLRAKLEDPEAGDIAMEISSLGVEAFLEYQYARDLDKASASCRTAVELLKTADIYQIPGLWQDVIDILNTKDITWFDLEASLDLFSLFISGEQSQGRKELARKMFQVATVKCRENPKSKTHLKYLEDERFRLAWFEHGLAFMV